ncbi:MAG TPA: IclR family transcriptional regulator [Euzebya sp.]|nr:IclR family transcriptional regulator [Euzebya sp.]
MSSSQVPAAHRAVAVLRELSRHSAPVPATAIARALELPRSSTYHLLAALEAEGFVTHLPEDRRWALGVAAFELGTAYLRQGRLERLARPLLTRLAAEQQLTAHLGVLDGRDLLYLVKEHPSGTPPVITEVGVRLPAHLTASGRALLSGLEAAQLQALYPGRGPLGRRTDAGPPSVAALRAELAATAARGWAAEDGEIEAGYRSVAVAATDHAGRPAAAVTVTGRRDRFGDPDAMSEVVRRTAAELSSRLRR